MKTQSWEFLGSPVVRTPCSHCQELGLRFCMPKKYYIKKKESKFYLYNQLGVDGDCVNIKIIYTLKTLQRNQ